MEQSALKYVKSITERFSGSEILFVDFEFLFVRMRAANKQFAMEYFKVRIHSSVDNRY